VGRVAGGRHCPESGPEFPVEELGGTQLDVKDVITKQGMKRSILKSGYLLEQRVEAVLNEADYYVETNAAYPDPVTGRSREVDVVAIGVVRVYAEPAFIFPTLICECENNAQPAVFFARESPISFLYHLEVRMAGIPVRILDERRPTDVPGEEEYVSLSELLRFADHHHYCRGPVATQYCTFARKNQNTPWVALHSDEQHDSLTTLINAVEFKIDEHYHAWSPPAVGDSESLNVEFYYPVLVLQGPLYTARLERGRLTLERSNHVQYRKEVVCPQGTASYQIDVVREPYLTRYLELVEAEMRRAKNVLRRHKGLVQRSIAAIVRDAAHPGEGETVREAMEF